MLDLNQFIFLFSSLPFPSFMYDMCFVWMWCVVWCLLATCSTTTEIAKKNVIFFFLFTQRIPVWSNITFLVDGSMLFRYKKTAVRNWMNGYPAQHSWGLQDKIYQVVLLCWQESLNWLLLHWWHLPQIVHRRFFLLFFGDFDETYYKFYSYCLQSTLLHWTNFGRSYYDTAS